MFNIYLYTTSGLASIIIKKSWCGIVTYEGKLNSNDYEMRLDNKVYKKSNNRPTGIKLIGNTSQQIEFDISQNNGCDSCCTQEPIIEYYNITDSGDIIGDIN